MRQREDTVQRIAYKREERKKTEEKREETREEKLWKSRTNCYRFASPADPYQMFRDSMEVHWIFDRVGQFTDAY